MDCGHRAFSSHSLKRKDGGGDGEGGRGGEGRGAMPFPKGGIELRLLGRGWRNQEGREEEEFGGVGGVGGRRVNPAAVLPRRKGGMLSVEGVSPSPSPPHLPTPRPHSAFGGARAADWSGRRQSLKLQVASVRDILAQSNRCRHWVHGSCVLWSVSGNRQLSSQLFILCVCVCVFSVGGGGQMAVSLQQHTETPLRLYDIYR